MKLKTTLRAAQSYRVMILASVLTLGLGAQAQAAFENKSEAAEAPPVAITVHDRHRIAYNSEGTFWYWEPTADLREPKIMQGLGDFTAVTAGPNTNNLILRKDGTVWEWGRKYIYTDGNNGRSEFPAPKQIKGLSDISKVSVLHSVDAALDKDGSVWVWITQPESSDPVKLENITKAKDIGIANDGVLILKEDGTVWNWVPYSSTGVPLQSYNAYKINELDNIAALSSGNSLHTFAIKKDGTVWGWGDNGDGALGLPSSIHNSYHPVLIDSLTDVESISTGLYTTAIVKRDGTVWVVGLTIGDPSVTYSFTPKIVDGLENVASVTLGDEYALALTRDGKLWSWGNINGGYDYSEKPIPVLLPNKDGSKGQRQPTKPEPAQPISTPQKTYNNQNIGIKLNGTYLNINPKAMIVDENTFIPLRGVIEAIGGKITWLNETQSITIDKGNASVNLKIGSKEALVNGSSVTLAVAPFISDAGYTYVPLRFVSDTLGAKVNWDAENWSAILNVE
ncbi:stalk domain-containing protein [Paenibacillus planticolens]|uniref:Copper amine oxidase-like N-terminal domain-containing protein n=1 Tax=Paenibacillus planticolens TaxID=2654976 RepID=A0ABX1ZQ15_9BACL|nr:stalk domain-containing protein [Paenibacillus planticolens]NOV01901.1 hypothetical protein [Paenibacillus planticolens]